MTAPKTITLEISVEEAADLRLLRDFLMRQADSQIKQVASGVMITSPFVKSRDHHRQLELVEKILEGLK